MAQLQLYNYLLRAALAVCSAIRTNKKTSCMPINQSLVSGALSIAHGARAGMTTHIFSIHSSYKGPSSKEAANLPQRESNYLNKKISCTLKKCRVEVWTDEDGEGTEEEIHLGSQ